MWAWCNGIRIPGSRITGYIIERRETSSSVWLKCNDYNVQDTSYTALQLHERADYEFRIIAVNAAGEFVLPYLTYLTYHTYHIDGLLNSNICNSYYIYHLFCSKYIKVLCKPF